MKKTNIPNLLKDEKTNVVINKEFGHYEQILAARKKQKENILLKQEINKLKEEVNFLFKHLGLK